MVRPGSQEVRDFLLDRVEASPERLVGEACRRFTLTRQAVHHHLNQLLEAGWIEGRGKTRARRYRIAVLMEAEEALPSGSDADADEESLWRRRFLPLLAGLPPSVIAIAGHGFLETARNARQHASPAESSVRLRRTAVAVEMRVRDSGPGIFRRLQAETGHEDPRSAALEIVRGEIHARGDRPPGRGLALVARTFDSFLVASGAHVLRRDERGGVETWRLDPIDARVRGTTVLLRIGVRSARRLEHVVAGMTERSRVPVALALDATAVAATRADARRVLGRIGSLRELVLDFRGVRGVTPSFADEALRVVAREHPRLAVSWVDAEPDVARILARAAADPSRARPETVVRTPAD